MKSKDRITAFICKSADGSKNLGLSLIGRAVIPRFIRVGKPHAEYFSQENTWSDRVVFEMGFMRFSYHTRKRQLPIR